MGSISLEVFADGSSKGKRVLHVVAGLGRKCGLHNI